MDKKDITVVICCAGMGKRLGIGMPKALLNIDGKPLIIRQLELLDDCDDVRIVVGYKAEEVIKTVLNYRKDVMFVFNYSYGTTSVVTSLKKALISARKYVLEIDGDILINSSDLEKILQYPGECAGCSKVYSNEPVYAQVENGKIQHFHEDTGDYEWTGLAKIKSSTALEDQNFLYMALEKKLPIDCVFIRLRDIDTTDDYIEALRWYNHGCDA